MSRIAKARIDLKLVGKFAKDMLGHSHHIVEATWVARKELSEPEQSS